jgi:hypothetical protein
MHLVTQLGHKTVFGTQPLQKGGQGTQPDLVCTENLSSGGMVETSLEAVALCGAIHGAGSKKAEEPRRTVLKGPTAATGTRSSASRRDQQNHG